MEQKKGQTAICTTGLIVINIGVFIIFTLLGKSDDVLFMRQYGAMYEPYVTEGHEYYRLFTSTFLHFGIEHLLNNMVMLGALGFNLEPEIGKVRFLLVYIISGIGGNICSLLLNVSLGDVVVSAGASGAVFGLMGALLCAVIRKKGRIGRLNKKGMLILAVFSIYVGLSEQGVDNAAHIGGLACGFVLEALLASVKRRASKTQSNETWND
ncbi:rhomboid family intramembrane serine protease [Schaedlerella sp.]|jgi:rhomboid protease GluP|uniref:rhomboid family intramembrane serine protease n=1 Tax=Schaedlerella sp. TaxID=2676057 RepID=UPI0037459A58